MNAPNAAEHTPTYLHLRQSDVSLVLAVGGGRLPRVLHWGADLGPLADSELAALAVASETPIGHNLNDVVKDISILPAFADGWVGRPGVEGSRSGRDWSPLFTAAGHELSTTPDGGNRLVVSAADDVARLSVSVEIELLTSGVLRARASLTNDAADDPYTVRALRIVLPVPTEAGELLDFTGRHCMERGPQRTEFTMGLHSREDRLGRTGLDAAYLLIAGEPGFGFRSGQVWGTHVAFSGNQDIYGERLYNGARSLGGGELLQDGEIILGRGESYASPWLYGSYGVGLDQMAGRFHDYLRARPTHPKTSRPVVINTWEAVYFDHDLATLKELADAASALGVERFVLDDGWFGSRRDDHSGLGDWTVSADAWPNGLGPIIDHVRATGMDFGLWVEPEMINTDSDLARAHPDWIFAVGGRIGSSSRFQHVLDLTHPEAYQYILTALDALLDEYEIAYLKWDHNRYLVEAGHTPSGRPAIHNQTLAAYALMDELKRRHPGLEIESCASGGGRSDLGIIEHTDRVWSSDCNDPKERQQILRWSKMLLPPELLGAHIPSHSSHTTLRQHDLQFRALPQVWCHVGVEVDIRTMSDDERAELGEWIAFYKANRELLHAGTVVNADHPDTAFWINGVVAKDQSEAIYGVVAMERSVAWPPGLMRLPGLDDAKRYRVSLLPPAAGYDWHIDFPLWAVDGVELSGRVLRERGLQIVPIHPEHGYLLHVEQIEPADGAPAEAGTAAASAWPANEAGTAAASVQPASEAV